MNKDLFQKIKKIGIKGAVVLGMVVVSVSGLSGCAEIPEPVPYEEYDIIDPNALDENGDLLFTTGLTKRLPVKGEDFDLITIFSCDNAEKRVWEVSKDKFLNFAINTDGLPAGYKVYIDNIHIDTFTAANNEEMDGILQDTMDDRIHNSLMYGFPISDTAVCYGVNAIEGLNEGFIELSFYGFRSGSFYLAEGTEEKRRYTEDNYMQVGVFGNKILIVIDLLVKGPDEEDYRNISVETDFIILGSSEKAKQNMLKLYK